MDSGSVGGSGAVWMSGDSGGAVSGSGLGGSLVGTLGEGHGDS